MQSYPAASDKKAFFVDVFFLIIISGLLQACIVKGLGFYSDDWMFLSIFYNSKDNSLLGLMQSFLTEPSVVVRPVFVLQLSVLYKLFKMHPLGYHIANSIVIFLEIIFFYLGLKKLKLPRVITIVIPLIYILLPHYSTTHIWVACCNANLSMALLFLNFYANLKFISFNKNNSENWLWLFVSIIGLSGSVLAYEVATPLFFVNFFIVWRKSTNTLTYSLAKNKFNKLITLNLILLVSCVAFKVLNTDRQGGFNGNYIGQIFSTIKAALRNDFILYGLKLPKVAWLSLSLYNDARITGTSIVVFMIVFICIIKAKGCIFEAFVWMEMIIVGIIIYLAGYATFLMTSQIQITPAGVSNRVEIAASIGVAICFLGTIGFLCSFIKSQYIRQMAFSIIVASLCTSEYIVKCTIASFYSNSYSLQRQALDSIFNSFPVFNPENTLILDGLCPYEGPAPVFECYWDISGAMQIHYNNKNIRADIRTDRLKYDTEGVVTDVYGEKKIYHFSENLIIYNVKSKRRYVLDTFEVADKYFSQISTGSINCPHSEPGYGVAIF
jgi:hypothetical protein